jgi:hypothetical protein
MVHSIVVLLLEYSTGVVRLCTASACCSIQVLILCSSVFSGTGPNRSTWSWNSRISKYWPEKQYQNVSAHNLFSISHTVPFCSIHEQLKGGPLKYDDKMVLHYKCLIPSIHSSCCYSGRQNEMTRSFWRLL